MCIHRVQYLDHKLQRRERDGGKLDDLLPWDASECDIDGCRSHMLFYRRQFESMATRAVVASIICFIAGLLALFFSPNSLGITIVLVIIAAYFLQESRRHAGIVNLLTAVWPIALLVNSHRKNLEAIQD